MINGINLREWLRKISRVWRKVGEECEKSLDGDDNCANSENFEEEAWRGF